MDEIIKGFRELALPTVTPMDYKGAEDFARQFKQCSALENHNISYSAYTTSENALIKAAIQNHFVKS